MGSNLKKLLEEATKKSEKYSECVECEEIAKLLINKHPELLEDASKAKIKYLKKSAEKSKFRGKCSRTTGKWSYLTGFDFVIEVWAEWWETATSVQKEALILHELRHITLTTTTSGKEKWVLRIHSLEEFLEVYKLYGAWCEELKDFEEEAKERCESEEDNYNVQL